MAESSEKLVQKIEALTQRAGTEIKAVKASIPNTSGLVPKSGSRGTVAGYEATGSNTTVDATSSDSSQTDSAVTVSDGASGTSWTKIVRLTGSSPSVTLGSSWVWSGGSAPTLTQNGILVCCWCGSGGIANFVSPS